MSKTIIVQSELPDCDPADAGLPRHFDPIFDRYRISIPLEYLRALAMRESRLQLNAGRGSCSGLLQISDVVRRDHNQANGTAYTRKQLLDPLVNVAVGCGHLRHIIESYQQHLGEVRNLNVDWGNPHFVELLTLGWNAGFSVVSRVVHHLAARGLEITLRTVQQHATAAGAARHLREPARFRWCRSVVDLYLRERAHAQRHNAVRW